MRPVRRIIRRIVGRRPTRRGTILLLALGVLAILSIAALSYVAVVRLDRAGTAALTQRASYSKQVQAVVDHIRDLLAADLFGEKVVTPDVPVMVNTVRNWPSMFEDGDWIDVPRLDTATLNTKVNPGDPSLPDAPVSLLQPGQRAYPDDAWLASIEPRWTSPDPSATRYWQQITNLLCAYRWDPGDPQSTADDRWVRGHGRYVDLSSWFLAPRNLYADPSRSLVDWSDNRVVRIGALAGSAGPSGDAQEVGVFDRQVNAMGGWMTPAYTELYDGVRPSDERQWVDTDGDLRPDARWQVLPSLEDRSGLRWIVAARIIDASALVNVNASIEFGGLIDYGDLARLGDGRTPADIDLSRLLRNAERPSPGSPYEFKVLTDRLFSNEVSFRGHLVGGLGLDAILDEAPAFTTVAVNPYNPWLPNAALDRTQRAVYWRLFGQNAMRPTVRKGRGYTVRELLDLGAFWATNNSSIVSKIEQFLDGTETYGYLPNDTSDAHGPMRTKESALEVRRWWSGVGDANDPITGARPTPRQIKDSARRLVTPVSGVGTQGPVPVLNPNNPYLGRHRTEKVRVDRPLSPASIRDAFSAFVWALAPLATDRPLTRTLADAGVGTGYSRASEDAHYGGFVPGGDRSPARWLYPGGAPFNIPNPNASFAAITAASLAANLADAVDSTLPAGAAPGTPTNETPTIIALYNNIAPPTVGPLNSTALGTRLPQGDIPAASLPWVDPNNPYIIVGLDRQPFLREATFMAFYSDYDQDRAGISTDFMIDTTSEAEAIGSGVMIVLTNPWPDPVNVDSTYRVVVPESESLIGDQGQSGEPFVMSLPTDTLAAGETKAYYWLLGGNPTPTETWDVVREEIRSKAEFSTTTAVEVLDAQISPAPGLTTDRLPFRNVIGSIRRGVLLVKQVGGTDLVIDRLRPPSGTNFPEFSASSFNFQSDQPDNFPGGFAPANTWFVNVLQYDPAMLAADARWNNGVAPSITGRLALTTSISRPTIRRNGSMPALVIEDPERNAVRTRADAIAWLHPPDVADPAAAIAIRDEEHSLVSLVIPGSGIDFPLQHLSGSDAATTHADSTNPYGAAAEQLPVFQLFVPNAGLIAVSDMLRLSIYAHTCKDAAFNSLDHWRTVSEKLGASLNYYYGDSTVTAVPNSYLGVLDPTRYVLTAAGASTGDLVQVPRLPDTMAIPLALRVPECFEAAPVSSSLVQGRVNINTAPYEVLEALPLVAPAYNLDAPAGAGIGIGAGSGRLPLIERYRDVAFGVQNLGDIPANELPAGLRQGDPSPLDPRNRPAGFAAAAELAILGRWERMGQGLTGLPAGAQAGTFLEVGADGDRNNFSPLQLQEYVDAAAMYPAGEQVTPIDGPEERLALYRAVSNIATVRSDVYLAWFVIRAYDPRSIERVRMSSNNPSLAEALSAMDNPDNNFQPVYESRWLLVLDRSQTESGAPLSLPTDRPRVLMQVELPSARP